MLLCIALGFGSRGLEWAEAPRTDDLYLIGRVRLRDGGDSAAPPTLRLVVDDATVSSEVSAAASRGVTTFLAFDGSGSFRPFHDRAFDLAEAYAANRLPNESIGLVVFGQTATAWKAEATESSIAKSLAEARALGTVQKETRLAASIRGAVDQAADEHVSTTGGVRRVVVFTDAGEESQVFPIEEIAAHARSRGVTVDAVIFIGATSRPLAEDLDRLSRLVALTGGELLEATPNATVSIDTLPQRSRELWDLRAPWCGEARPEVAALGPNGLHTPTLPLDGPLMACAAPLVSSSRVAEAQPTLPSALVEKASGLACLVLALLGFATLGGLAVWAARRSERRLPRPEPTTPETPEPPAPKPPEHLSETETEATIESRPLPVNLPETHLEVVRGDLAHGTRWRFAGRILRLGASEGDNEAVVNLPQISSRHARFDLHPSGAVFVEDLGSANGTWVGRNRLKPGVRVEIPANSDVTLSSQLVVRVVRPNSVNT